MVIHRRLSEHGVVLLATQVATYGMENIPPVTLALIAGQTAIFLNAFPKYFPSPTDVCISTFMVHNQQDWRRMITATFYHATDMHLYFNMASLLYKGAMLENLFGTPYFAYLIIVFSALTSATYVGLGWLFSRLFGNPNFLMSCAVGFSGVLFALKVLTTYYSPNGTQYLFGIIPIPSKYFYWIELVFIQLVTPNASFIGHLAGVLVGVAYCHGPLKWIMDSIFPPGRPPSRSVSDADGFQPPMPQIPQVPGNLPSGFPGMPNRDQGPAFPTTSTSLPPNYDQATTRSSFSGRRRYETGTKDTSSQGSNGSEKRFY